MDDVDGVVDGVFVFRVPVWTVAYTGLTDFRIAAAPTKSKEYGDSALALFTDEDQANRWLASCTADGETFRVVEIEDPQQLEFWLSVAEKLGLIYVAFDYTHGIGSEQRGCSGMYETITEIRRLAQAMRPIQ